MARSARAISERERGGISEREIRGSHPWGTDTKALTSSLIRPALGSDPRFRARLPDREGNPQRAGGAHGSLVQYAIPRAGGEARHAKGDE